MAAYIISLIYILRRSMTEMRIFSTKFSLPEVPIGFEHIVRANTNENCDFVGSHQNSYECKGQLAAVPTLISFERFITDSKEMCFFIFH